MIEGQKYEAVIGLEIHAQLATKSKLFCGDATSFGAEPNTHISPITMGHPGTLPKTNAKAIEYAIRMGLICGSKIAQDNYFARKNYFYPDLPKGYQVSQHTTPICLGGSIAIQLPDAEKIVQLNRIHLEEDAGKSIHDLSATDTLIDLNRAGTPLIEMVTEPCIHSAEEAFLFVTEVRKLVRWIGICDGNMEEGSLRCDANISIRLKGATRLGTRVEVKNLNSIRNIKKAIEFEIERLIQITETGGAIIQQTRSFDASNDTTFSIRDKEDANDYRYFPDPDLAPFHLTEAFIETIKNKLPTLPATLKKQWKIQYDLSDYAINQLVEDKEEADFYIQWAAACKHYKAIANWMIGPIRAVVNEGSLSFQQLSSFIPYLVELVELVEKNQLSFSVASTRVLKEMMARPGSPMAYATINNLLQTGSTDDIEKWIDEVLVKHPEKVAAYKKGKKGLLGVFVGEVKKISKGKADPKMTASLLEQKLA
ncbi:MAG: Asp-tRNA(Asn)/Glu-tRNA(Gln) amidotransferase subunit GatB [Sediminibacterium sp.]|jgi:aspartyl-tRNA(Asn)/glutamyl-tRNA(Gln) amidotransferase subunit B|nr:MAG: Asp-tRNA(Asn)/Glu-tRNA(Gln) amidotransferase subunit GatB [Sediminibacterium sp.]